MNWINYLIFWLKNKRGYSQKKRPGHEAKHIEEQRDREMIRPGERENFEEKLQGELKLTEEKLDMEKGARAAQAKLVKLKILPFNETVWKLDAVWINVYYGSSRQAYINDEEKCDYSYWKL